MPINAGPEYYIAEKRFLEARSKEEKIQALEEMIRLLPKHKGTHNVLAQLRKRLSRLKSESVSKATAKPSLIIKKEGAGQVCIIGLTKCGKSSLLKALTNVDVEIADYPYTTKKPVVGMMEYGDIQIQLIEIPSTFNSESIGLLHTCDEILVLLDSTDDIEKQKEELFKILDKNRLLNKKQIVAINKCESRKMELGLQISAKNNFGLEDLKRVLWSNLELIRVYTKSPGKPKDYPPITLPIDSTVKDVAKGVHKDFLKTFKFARVFNDTLFSGQKVGLGYRLHDLDVVEIHAG